MSLTISCVILQRSILSERQLRPLTEDSTEKMLRRARMAGMTGRTAAYFVVANGRKGPSTSIPANQVSDDLPQSGRRL
jgi:hypothetical protein